nr:ATP-binding protein [Spirosoma utsteinense]
MRFLYLLIFLPSWLLAQPKSEFPRQVPSGLIQSDLSTITVLNDTTRFLSVGPRINILEDKTGQLTFEQVRQRRDFKPEKSESFQYGFSSSAYWFRFELINRSQENTRHWLLGLLDATTLDYVDLYLVYPQGHVRHVTGGLKRPYVDQGFFAMTPFFRVELPTNARVTVFFRIKSSLALYGKVTVWDEYYNLSKGRVAIFAIWMFLGLFILRSLNNFVLARFIPDPQFRFYAVCTFLLYLSTLSRTGIYPILFSGYPRLLDWMNYGMGRLLPLGLAVWMYNLLDNRPVFRVLKWLLLGVMAVEGAGVLIAIFVQTDAIGRFFAYLMTLMYGLFFLNVFLIWFTPQRTRYHFVLPIVFCAIPFFLFQLQSLSIISYRPVISQLALLALAVEMVSMSLVLGRIVQTYIKDRITTANALMLEKVEVDKLQELNGVKTQFFANISHEFRTPLTLILGPLADLKERFPNESMLNVMERNGNRLLSLINQLLDLSKLEAGKLKAEPEPGDMASFLRTLASAFNSLADSRVILFSFQQSRLSYWANFDRDKIEKIVTNLLANAFKFTPDGSEVAMTVSYQTEGMPHALVISVRDTGIGIAVANLPRIFDRFYQVDGKANRNYEGTGIGLAMVDELVRVLNGTIAVASTEGVGTTFTVTLPLVGIDPPQLAVLSLVQQATQPDVPVMQLVAKHVSEQGMVLSASQLRPFPVDSLPVTELLPQSAPENLLLVIDDNADIRAYVRSIFEADYQVIEAIDGQDGLERATVMLPNIVICDLMMPRLDGFGFCRALKTGEATSHIPVVMLTAKATVEDRIEGFELGADDYLTKPFNRVEIRARVRNLIQQRQRLYQHFIAKALLPAATQPVPELAEPAKPALLAAEQKFLDRLTAVVMQHLDDADFTVEALAEGVNMSRTQLHRKLKALTDTTATLFIRDIRLTRAAELLRTGADNVSQVAHAVGFDSLSYFAKVFQERYGVLPSHYGRASSAGSKLSPQ